MLTKSIKTTARNAYIYGFRQPNQKRTRLVIYFNVPIAGKSVVLKKIEVPNQKSNPASPKPVKQPKLTSYFEFDYIDTNSKDQKGKRAQYFEYNLAGDIQIINIQTPDKEKVQVDFNVKSSFTKSRRSMAGKIKK